MFDEQFVTTSEKIKEPREALVKLGLEIVRCGMDVEFNEAQIAYSNANARMELTPRGDEGAKKAAETTNRRLFALCEKGWKKGDKLLFYCYREYKKRLCYQHRTEG